MQIRSKNTFPLQAIAPCARICLTILLAMPLAALLAGAAEKKRPKSLLQLYEGPARPAAVIGIVHYGHGLLGGKNVIIALLSGPGVHWNGLHVRLSPPAAPAPLTRHASWGAVRDIELLPGRYAFSLQFQKQAGNLVWRGQELRYISVTIEAGHEYDLTSNNNPDGSWWAKLTDKRTGVVIEAAPEPSVTVETRSSSPEPKAKPESN